MTKDPVCEIDVDETEAMSRGLTIEHHCQTSYFCSTDCRDRFEANPDQFLLSFWVPPDEWPQTQWPVGADLFGR